MDINDVLNDKSKDELKQMIADLQSNLEQKEKSLSDKQKLIQQLYEQLKLARHQQFGRKSEKQVNEQAHQASLFNEAFPADNQAELEKADREITVASYQRKKTGRKPLPQNLPRYQRIHDLSEDEKVCRCGCQLTVIGEEKSEQLEHVPAKTIVIEHIRKKYACKQCEQTIKTAKAPKQPIPKSIAGPGLLAHILVSKFSDHLPLYRQEQILQRIGIDIPRSTLSHWVIRCSELLSPLVKLMQSHIENYDIAYADETTVQVLKEPGRLPESKSYMWCFAGGEPDKFNCIYHYQASRSHEVPLNYLAHFSGYLHCDGYPGYDVLSRKSNITLVGCWYHARRKFVEAGNVSNKSGLADHALKTFAILAKLEKQAKQQKLSPQAIYELRQRKALPIIDKFKIWLEQQLVCVPAESLIGKAITYTLKQWAKLINYLDDGRLEISNNRLEQCIKPFALSRKNWLFADSVKGANASATIFSLIQTCKLHNVNVYDYLRAVLEIIPNVQTIQELEQLLPYSIQL